MVIRLQVAQVVILSPVVRVLITSMQLRVRIPLTGGLGTNTLDFSNGGSPLTINIGSGTATGWGADTFVNFTKIVGSNNGDTITGSTG